MILPRSHRTRSRRGSVIVLVVAVLALLAVIGTVYIVSARAGRTSASAANVAVNLELARDAVNTIAIQPIGDSMYDANGIIGGYAGSGSAASSGLEGYKGARRWDIPEGDPAALYSSSPFSASLAPDGSAIDPSMRDESWLADGIYRPNSGSVGNGFQPFNPYLNAYPPGFNAKAADPRYNSLSLVTPGFFDPATGGYLDPATNKYELPFLNSSPYALTVDSYHMFQTVAPNLTNGGVAVRLPLANGSHTTTADADSYINLLPFSDASGIRYRYGVRIVDTSSMLNVNVGMSYGTSPPSPTEITGTYFTGYNLSWYNQSNPSMSTAFNANPSTQLTTPNDVPSAIAALGTGRLGPQWAPTGGPPDYVWSRAALSFDAQNPPVLQSITPYDLADELELRSYGALGTTFTPRFASTGLWPNTLGNQTNTGTVLNPSRNFYTTYSWSRDLRPFAAAPDLYNLPAYSGPIPVAYAGFYATPAVPAIGTAPYLTVPYTLALGLGGTTLFDVPMNGTTPWPQFPACVSANPETSSYLVPNLRAVDPQTAGDRMAAAATNIATVMKMTGYSDAQIRAFATNYLTYRWNSWTPSGASGSYALFGGPSIMDNQGLCLRGNGLFDIDYTSMEAANIGGLNATAGATGVPFPSAKVAAHKVFLGYAAQPFLNEVVLTMTPSSPGPPMVPASVSDFAVELYNPYEVPMSLDGFGLTYHAATNSGKVVDYDFTGQKLFIPAHGYFVIAYSSGTLKNGIAGTAKSEVSDANFKLPTLSTTPPPPSDNTLYLMRKYFPRGVTSGGAGLWGAIDRYDITKLMAEQAVGSPQSFYLARSNANTANPNIWVAAVESPNSESTPQTGLGSLGAANPYTADKDADGAPPLYDRALSPPVSADILGDKTGISAIVLTGATKYDPRGPLANIADFNRIMRICNEIDSSTGLPVDEGTVSNQLYQIVANPTAETGTTTNYLAASALPIEAHLHFDFAADAEMYSNLTGGVPNLVLAPARVMGDPRAVWLLDCLAFTDRVSDNYITVDPTSTEDPGFGKLRIPGRINVNTAPPEVLENIPALTTYVPLAYSSTNVSPITVILAYRWRTTGTDPRIPGTLQSSKINFAGFPGYGIHSLAELNAAFTDAYAELSANGKTFPATTVNTLDLRDALWGDMYNYLTVRSDTFVLYGYLEAVKPNPRYTGGAIAANGAVWYGNIYGTDITDDPADSNITNIPLLRVGRRRWVALVDRSQMNYNLGDPRLSAFGGTSAKPRIVAMRDLPQ